MWISNTGFGLKGRYCCTFLCITMSRQSKSVNAALKSGGDLVNLAFLLCVCVCVCVCVCGVCVLVEGVLKAKLSD